MVHTGQGQIIGADALTQDKHGNWIPATPEPYHASFFDKVACLLGWHSWSFDLERVGNNLVVPDMIPDHARCIKCAKVYGDVSA
jgi:hypothetical protein